MAWLLGNGDDKVRLFGVGFRSLVAGLNFILVFFALKVFEIRLFYYSVLFGLVCFGRGLAVVHYPVVDFLLGFDLCRSKRHLLRGQRTEVEWIFPSTIIGFSERALCVLDSYCARRSSFCRKYAQIVLLSELSVSFT